MTLITFGDGNDAISDVDIATTPDGGFVVTWTHVNRDSQGGNINKGCFVQRFEASGQPIDEPVALTPLATRPSVYGFSPSVSTYADGSFKVAWTPDKLDEILGISLIDSNSLNVQGSTLYTAGADEVDFNDIEPLQQLAIDEGANLYNSLDGDDLVLMPDGDSRPLLHWDTNRPFFGG